jgi:catechol 2,3-dioxygenase-like lactoylglutathione lyase family enzyme
VSEPRVDLGIVVRDIDACLPFYRDVLGMKSLFDLPLPGSHLWFLQWGATQVKLVVHDDVPAAANPPGGSRGGTGLRYFTIVVEDIDAALAACEAAGAPIPMPVLEISKGVKIAFVEDPEGNAIELLQGG